MVIKAFVFIWMEVDILYFASSSVFFFLLKLSFIFYRSLIFIPHSSSLIDRQLCGGALTELAAAQTFSLIFSLVPCAQTRAHPVKTWTSVSVSGAVHLGFEVQERIWTDDVSLAEIMSEKAAHSWMAAYLMASVAYNNRD